MKIKYLVNLFLSTLVLLQPGCTDADKQITTHMNRGIELLNNQHYDKARVEFKNVLQINPKNGYAYYYLGNIEEQRGELKSALRNYTHSLSININIVESHIRLGQLYLLQAVALKNMNDPLLESNALKSVKNHLDIALNKDPKNIDAILLQASLHAYNDNINEAIKLLEASLTYEQDTYNAITKLVQLYELTKQIDNAENTLIKAIKIFPENIDYYRDISKFYMRHNEIDKAINQMQLLIKKDPESLGFRITLASYYAKKGKPLQAEHTYIDAIKNKPEDSNRYILYSKYLSNKGDTIKAISIIKDSIIKLPKQHELYFHLHELFLKSEQLTQSISTLNTILKKWNNKPITTKAKKKLIDIYLHQKDTHKANELIKLILQQNPNDTDMLTRQGKIALKNKDYQLAITNFRSILKNQPDHLKILELLAFTYKSSGNTDLAEDTFSKMINLMPRSTDSQIREARYQFANKHISKAKIINNSILDIDPEHIAALFLQSEIQLSENKTNEAINTLRKLKLLSPDDATAWFRMGRIYKIQDNNEQAIIEFNTAWEKDPNSYELLAELIDLEISTGKVQSAETRLNKILSKNDRHPVAHKFLAMLYMSTNKPGDALAELKTHINYYPEDYSANIKSAEINILLNDFDEAENYYDKSLKLDPDSTETRLGIAGLYEKQKKFNKAIEKYQSIINDHADNIIAINNLALIYINKKPDGDSLIKAQKLMEPHKDSSHPFLLDTLGLVYYRQKEYQDSITAFKKALEVEPKVAVIQYHLAMSYYVTKQYDKSRSHLQKAIALGSFPGRQSAITLLERIKQSD